MSQEQLVSAYVRGDISRRTFIRRLVAVGVSLSAAIAYAELLGRTSVAQAAPQDFYDGCAAYYDDASMRPVVSTLAADQITETTARLRGQIEPKYRTARVRFAHGETTAYGSTTPEERRSAPGTYEVSANLSGLRPGTTYHARIAARNPAGCADGGDVSFTTVAAPAADPPQTATATSSSAPPPPAPLDLRAPLTTLAARSTELGAILRRRRIVLRLASDEAGSVLLGATAIQVTSPPRRRLGRGRAKPRKRVVTIARASVVFPAPGTQLVPLRLTLGGRRLLARLDRAAVQIVATATDAAGNRSTSRLMLRLSRKRR